jgi:hypothetical protein
VGKLDVEEGREVQAVVQQKAGGEAAYIHHHNDQHCLLAVLVTACLNMLVLVTRGCGERERLEI